MAKTHHPDKFADPAEKQVRTVEFQILYAAYDTLVIDSLRAQYDHKLSRLRSISKLRYQLDTFRKRRQERKKERDANSRLSKRANTQAGMLVTQGFIGEQKINAMPDTGAGYNLISSSLAQVLGITLPQSEALGVLNIRMANGKSLRTIGVIDAIWSFETDTEEEWTLNFHVIEDFFRDAVLGNDFLLATQTMSKNQHRLSRIPPPMHALSVLYVNSLGHVTTRLRGSINNLPIDALPDSGSESNILSFEYIQRNAWDSDIDSQDIRLLVFPDGTVGRTMGSLRLHWRYGTSAEDEGIEVDFHILYGCVYDAILGEEMLDETQAFTEHQDSFVDADLHKELPPLQSELNLVIWLPFKGSTKRKRGDLDLQDTTVDESTATEISRSAELKRMAAADHAIERMKKGIQKDNAVAEETEIRWRFAMNSEYTQVDNDRRVSDAQHSQFPLQINDHSNESVLEERRMRMSPGASFHPRMLGYYANPSLRVAGERVS